MIVPRINPKAHHMQMTGGIASISFRFYSYRRMYGILIIWFGIDIQVL